MIKKNIFLPLVVLFLSYNTNNFAVNVIEKPIFNPSFKQQFIDAFDPKKPLPFGWRGFGKKVLGGSSNVELELVKQCKTALVEEIAVKLGNNIFKKIKKTLNPLDSTPDEFLGGKNYKERQQNLKEIFTLFIKQLSVIHAGKEVSQKYKNIRDTTYVGPNAFGSMVTLMLFNENEWQGVIWSIINELNKIKTTIENLFELKAMNISAADADGMLKRFSVKEIKHLIEIGATVKQILKGKTPQEIEINALLGTFSEPENEREEEEI